MAISQKEADRGWFYHAPSKPKRPIDPPQDIPPPSQIPGLSNIEFPPEEPKQMMFKASDSKYVQLAKMGGRQDLLRMRTPKPRKEEAVGYPRVDWFYLEDNAMEDASKKVQPAPYQFMLPDYMVHENCIDTKDTKEPKDVNQNNNTFQKKRLPYAFDKNTPYDREVYDPTDKTVKLEEDIPIGYGIRQDKMKDKHVKHEVIPVVKGKPPQEYRENQRKFAPIPKQQVEDRTNMSKILSFGYQRDWEQSRGQWQEKQQRIDEKNPPEKGQLESEYQASWSKKEESQPTRKGSAAKQDKSVNNPRSAGKTGQNQEKEAEMFKLSKFKNVPAKTSSHRNVKQTNGQ